MRTYVFDMTNFIEKEGFMYYVSGFVDGEGCFSVSFRKLERLSIKIETRVSFSVAQKIAPENYAILLRIRDLFHGGSIRKDNTGCYKYETRSIVHIKEHVIPFFKRYPLYTSKARDFLFFCDICSLVLARQHLSNHGLRRVLELAQHMNPSGKRRYQLSIFLDLLKKNE